MAQWFLKKAEWIKWMNVCAAKNSTAIWICNIHRIRARFYQHILYVIIHWPCGFMNCQIWNTKRDINSWVHETCMWNVKCGSFIFNFKAKAHSHSKLYIFEDDDDVITTIISDLYFNFLLDFILCLLFTYYFVFLTFVLSSLGDFLFFHSFFVISQFFSSYASGMKLSRMLSNEI